MVVEDSQSLFSEDAYSHVVNYMLQPIFSLLVPPFSTPTTLASAVETVNLIMWSKNENALMFLSQYAKHILGCISKFSNMKM